MTAHPAPRGLPIDPALRAYLDSLAPPPGTPVPETDAQMLAARRAALAGARAARAEIAGLPNGVTARDIRIAGALPARLFTPPGATGPLPLLVYLHGGGWAAGSLETHDPFCRLLSGAAGVMILSVDYRLAPEHPFPAGLEDARAAARWARAEAAGHGADPARLAIGGDSAGANLAAAALNGLAAGEGAAFKAQVLLYPVTDHPSGGHASYAENATGYGLEAALMGWFWKTYAPGVAPGLPDVSPLRHPALPPLPPTLVATAQYDVLRDEGIAYADKLRAAGVAVRHLHAGDMHHDFPALPGTVGRFPQCAAALAAMADWLKATLG